MSHHQTLATLLKEFGSTDDPLLPSVKVSPLATTKEGPATSGFVELPQAGTSSLEDAYNRGREEGQREAEARFQHELGEQHAAAEMMLEQSRKNWVEQQGQVLSNELTAAVQDMHHQLANCFVEVLLPIIHDEVRRDAVGKIAATIRQTVPNDWQGPLRVEGPADLLEVLRENLGEMAALIKCQTVEAADIKVTIDETVLETQLEVWGEFFKRAAV